MTGDRGHRLVPPTGTSTATYPGAVSDFASFDLDLEVARAWTRFQADLAGRLADLADLGHLVIEVETAPEESDEPARFVQFAVEEPTVRLEVSASTAASDPHRLSPDDERHLYDLGLQPPDFDNVSEEGTPNWFIDGEIDDADRLSVIAVRVLRKVFGIPHPAFLIGAGMAIEDSDAEAGATVTPTDHAHLRTLVDRALEEAVGHPPHHDEDDDIPIVCGSALVWVTVRTDMPAVELLAWAVLGVTRPGDALFEVNELNQDQQFIRFALIDDRIAVRATVLAYPFSPTHLHYVLGNMAEAIDGLDDDLANRVGGSTWAAATAAVGSGSTDSDEDDEDDDDDDLHPALQTIIELEADDGESVSPGLAAEICDHDRDLLLSLIRSSSLQEIGWRESHEEAVFAGDRDEAAACALELESWEATTRLLRRALRLVVESGQEDPGDD